MYSVDMANAIGRHSVRRIVQERAYAGTTWSREDVFSTWKLIPPQVNGVLLASSNTPFYRLQDLRYCEMC